VAETGDAVIQRYLQDAIAAEHSFETQLRSFASDSSDDDEVRSLFNTHASETKVQIERLTRRLEALGGSPSASKNVLAHLFSFTPKSAQVTHTADERAAQNLMAAYTVEQAECAMYEALANVARAAGDAITEQLAREIQAEEAQTAAKAWSFLPSRAKIAFNLLTALEVDPAVETRTADDRIV
jgi:ferritin-like metal-binding protein YciE